MRTLAAFFVALILVSIKALSGEPPAIQTTIQGKIQNEVGEPLRDVDVRLVIPAGDMRIIRTDTHVDGLAFKTQSDKDGAFIFNVSINNDQYEKASIDAFLKGYHSAAGPLYGAQKQHFVELKKEPISIPIILAKSRYVSGVVVDENDKPIPGVIALGYVAIAGASLAIGKSITSERGEFEFFDFPLNDPLNGGPVLGILFDDKSIEKSLIVESILQDFPAHKSGIAPGDQVVSINSTALKTVADALALIKTLNGHCKIDIVRNGVKKTIELDLNNEVREKKGAIIFSHKEFTDGCINDIYELERTNALRIVLRRK